MKLSIVIPAYNESKNLKSGSLSEVNEYLKKQNYSYQVLIVDDGSTDNTADLIEQQIKNFKNFNLIKNPHGGKTITVMSGMLKAQGEIALFTDMDQATPISEIEKLMPKFNEGCEVVIGSREGRKGAPLVRKIAAAGFALCRNIILGLPFKDTQCGFKAFKHGVVEKVYPEMLDRWKNHKTGGAAVNAEFDVELLFLCKKRGYKIAEVPVDWHHVGTERVQLVRDAIEAIEGMLKIRINDLTGEYKE